MKKILGIIAVVIVALVVLSLVFGGNGDGDGNGDASEKTEVSSQQETETEVIEETEELSKVVTVTIQEDKVYVGKKEIANENELKSYIEEINNDEREFQLKDENSILETYEWVIKVFEDLKVDLLPVTE